MSDHCDYVIRNVSLVDGTGQPARMAHVALLGDKIRRVSEEDSVTARTTIEGQGLVLAPGFIDIHSHADMPLLVDGRAHSAVTQGITSVIPGNCGFGVAPFLDGGDLRQKDMPLCGGADLDEFGDITSFSKYLDELRQRGVGVNVVPLVAHGLLRASVAGFEMRSVTRSELSTMVGMAEEALDAGAAGLSSGLEYAPGIAATTEELIALAAPVGSRALLYATHCRQRGAMIVDAAEESVRVAEESGARLQMSHFLRHTTEPDTRLVKEALERLREADRRGVRTRCDVYPFEYGPSPITAFVPQAVKADAGIEFGSMLQDKRYVDQIAFSLEPRFEAMLAQGAAGTMYIGNDGRDGRYAGQTLQEVADSKNVSPAQAAITLLAEAGDRFGSVMVNERWADWADLRSAMADPAYIIMGDGSIGNLDGPLSDQNFALSDWGYATTTLGRFVRELQLLTLEEAIRRMTSAPAEQVGLRNRGNIREGFAADLVLFDPTLVGSDVRPDDLAIPSTGICDVFVNGVPVVRNGRVTNATPGRVGLHDVCR